MLTKVDILSFSCCRAVGEIVFIESQPVFPSTINANLKMQSTFCDKAIASPISSQINNYRRIHKWSVVQKYVFSIILII